MKDISPRIDNVKGFDDIRNVVGFLTVSILEETTNVGI